MNFGRINLSKNPDVNALFRNFLKTKKNIDEIKPDEKHFIVINDTNEKFLFKSFAAADEMGEYINELDNPDFFQDIALAFEYFNDFAINHIVDLFVEEKYFSFMKLIMTSFYAQLQGSYLLAYLVLFLVNNFVMKKDVVVSFLFIFSNTQHVCLLEE